MAYLRLNSSGQGTSANSLGVAVPVSSSTSYTVLFTNTTGSAVTLDVIHTPATGNATTRTLKLDKRSYDELHFDTDGTVTMANLATTHGTSAPLSHANDGVTSTIDGTADLRFDQFVFATLAH